MIGSLFSGYGGLDMAVEAVFPDARPAWFCEWDDAPSKILAHHWPDVPNLRDVTVVDWSQVEPVDIITGGSPCQDLSHAGKRAGMTEGTRSNLWVNMREAVNILRPRYVVWENVLGALSAEASSDSDVEPGTGLLGGGGGHLRALGRVLGDFAEIGYDARWATVRASDVGAPHHRARVFLLATPADDEGSRRDHGEAAHVGSSDREVDAFGDDRDTVADSAGVGLEAGEQPVRQSAQVPVDHGGGHVLPHAKCSGRDGREVQRDRPPVVAAGNGSGTVGIEWGAYAPAVRRWEQLTRPAPAPTELNSNGKPRLNAEFASWMMGLPAGHVTGVDIPRTAQLKAIGNGVCPQQAAFALRQLLELEAVAS